MSYETANYLPAGVTKRQAVEFAELLGYRRAGTYAHLGSPDVVSLVFFEDRDYRSWQTVELSIAERKGAVVVGTRTRIGRSHYDFAMQNRTVREFRKRFGGKTFKDDGNGAGYDPGPPYSPPQSGCKLAMDRLAWNLSRLQRFLMTFEPPAPHPSMLAAEQAWPGMRQLNPKVFAANAILPYVTSMMEDYLKSTYVALLRYSANKESVFRNARIRGDQLVAISNGVMTVEEAVSENMPFHTPSNIGQYFRAIDAKLDILAPLRRTSAQNKTSLLSKLDKLVATRHALVHGMNIDISIDTDRVEYLLVDVTEGLALIYKQVTSFYGWDFELPMSGNFRAERQRIRAGQKSRSSQQPQLEQHDTPSPTPGSTDGGALSAT